MPRNKARNKGSMRRYQFDEEKKRWCCEECPKDYSSNRGVINHWNEEHKVANAVDAQKKPDLLVGPSKTERYRKVANGRYECNDCERTFMHRTGAGQHWRGKHGEGQSSSSRNAAIKPVARAVRDPVTLRWHCQRDNCEKHYKHYSTASSHWASDRHDSKPVKRGGTRGTAAKRRKVKRERSSSPSEEAEPPSDSESEESENQEDLASDSLEKTDSEVKADGDDDSDDSHTHKRTEDRHLTSADGLSNMPTTINPREVMIRSPTLTPSPGPEPSPSSPEWASDTSSVHYEDSSRRTAHQVSRSQVSVAKRTPLSLRQRRRYGMMYTCQQRF